MAAGDRFFGPNVATGELVGTGDAITVTLDFLPQKVEIINRTNNTFGFWFNPMPSASAQITVDSGSGTTDVSFITTKGITAGNSGFILGANASLNSAASVIYWVAYR
jgi:hypothetical protein